MALLDEAPAATSLNAGFAQPFPRINAWVLVPSEVGYLVGVVTWIGIDNAPLPREAARTDPGLLDVPFPRRRMAVAPLGTLRWGVDNDASEAELVRGIVSYPSVGESVLVPDAAQLRIIGSVGGSHATIPIGHSSLAGDAEVLVNPDRLFGRHLAVLGSTGSGKSCTVAGLIRWSLAAAKRETHEGNSQARFIILDPNGEYRECFKDLTGVRVLRVEPDDGEYALTVPGWTWSSAEWAAITRASLQTQRPLLQRALRNLRNNIDPEASGTERLAVELRAHLDIWTILSSDPASYFNFPKYTGFTKVLEDMSGVFSEWADEEGVESVLRQVEDMRTRHDSARQYGDQSYVSSEVSALCETLRNALEATGVSVHAPRYTEDMPVRFDPRGLPDHLEALLRTPDFQRDAGYASSLQIRVKGLVNDLRHQRIIAPMTDETLEDWLRRFLGDETCANGEVAVVDLSLLAAEVMHAAVAVIGRLTMDALQHVRATTGTVLPTVLVLEEAHNFVSAATSGAEIPTTADLCRETFNRIAREGRKFGLGLVLSSQRPSALSQTVLSQCNSFLLHRLVNDRDQDLVARLVPDSLGDLLHELPSLPPRHAILLGWAAEIPTLVEIRNLEGAQRPQSEDPQFWNVWTGTKPVDFTWEEVVSNWTT
ncbi:ATP-binding protein (plasmid) [Rhodococcus pyridinivorans]|uniref:ATP-binding protein n=1 Tax=Rhodococcus pyridinivorans TaxID=103816 RepID=UPI001FFF1869|nr:ATP-binding protein [Rhodococcus pyridinivorans]UPK66460.1 ATP-binding protein [Rhodococcus pyridinivorans]